MKVIRISNCIECPYSQFIIDSNYWACFEPSRGATPRYIRTANNAEKPMSGIPDWCELEDEEDKDA